jgi:hypothetical protein
MYAANGSLLFPPLIDGRSAMQRPYFDLPPGDQLARRNRLLVADRCGWPAGTVAVCEQIDQDYPDWFPVWYEPGKGFLAGRQDWRHGERAVYGATGEELIEQIKG